MTVKVLIKNRCPSKREIRHIPGIVFTFDVACRDYDWLLVYDEMVTAERLRCPWQHTILATQEPVSVKSYSRAYVRQFAHYLTNRPFKVERHPGWYFGRGYYQWYNGHSREELQTLDFSKKDKLISTVCSSKQMRHTQHHARYELIRHLAGHIDGFDWFGRGVRPLEGGKKYVALDGYRYHVAVENHIAPGHWSEKIADSILSECLTFYAGDPDLGNVLPPDSFIPIPIDNPERAAEIIRRAIADGEYEKRRPAILAAKRLLLEQYNLYAQVAELVKTAARIDCKPCARIFPRKSLRWRSPFAAIEDGWRHLIQFAEMIGWRSRSGSDLRTNARTLPVGGRFMEHIAGRIAVVMLAKGRGGLEAVAVQHARLFHKDGFDTAFICHRNSPYAVPSGVCRIPIFSASRWNPFVYLAIWRGIRRMRPDQIWCHGTRALSVCRMIRFALPGDVRLIGVAHNARSGKMRRADLVVAVSKNVRDELVGRWRLPSTKVVCAPNAIAVPEHPSPVRHIPPVVGFLGRMDSIKGVDTLLDAMADLKNNGVSFRLLMAGSGPQERYYRNRCKALKLDGQTTWLGWIEDKERFFAAIDVFCLPSQSEGLGISLLEAMAYGRPVVGSDCPAIKALVDDSTAGVTFPVGDALALSHALEKMLSLDEVEYTGYSKRARKFVIDEFSEDRLLKDLSAIAQHEK